MRSIPIVLAILTPGRKVAVPSFELDCGMAKQDCIDAWSTRGIESAIAETLDSLLFMILCDIVRDVVDRIAKVELQLCAHHGDEPHIEPRIRGNDGEL